ncbi:MAG: hypothetical protein Q9196_005434, partial [Gyalolechia fulgens]
MATAKTAVSNLHDNRRRIAAGTTASSTTGQDGNGNEGADEEDVEEDGEESEEGETAEEACQDDGKSSVYDSASRHALHSFHP